MTAKEQFKILSPRDHVRLRTGVYLGSVSNDTIERFVKGIWTKATFVPAIFKMINEIIDNSVDELIRSDFKFATKIDVSVEDGWVIVTDNGRGLPQDEVHDAVTDEVVLRPVAAWTKTNAGTSFDNERVSIGANGLGAALVAYMSTEFVGQTWSGGNKITVTATDGAADVKVKQTAKIGSSGTIVKFKPDFQFFECDSLEDGDLLDLVEDRLMSLQLAFPECTFSFNHKRIQTTTINKYAELFTQEGASVIVEKSDNLSFFFAASEDGFRTNSFINGVNTYLGGTYVDYITNGVVEELVDMIKRKHKLEVTKSTIKNGLTMILFARNFVNPKFDSQTKERLTSSVSAVKEHMSDEKIKDFKALAKKIFAAADIIEPLIAAQLAKKEADEHRNTLVAQKKLKKVRVAKHVAATSQWATLCLVEGDSAIQTLIDTRDPKMIGGYPLRGVVMNTWDRPHSEVLKNKELSELISVLGLNIQDKDSYKNMTYKNIGILTDADHDGAHIATLLVGFFKRFWPGIIKEHRLVYFKSPVQISSKGSDIRWFYDYESGEIFKHENQKGWDHRHIKGLGSLTPAEYSIVINKPFLRVITDEEADLALYEMMLGSDSDARKEFMMAA